MFVTGKPFQPGLIFLSKVVAYTSEAPFRCYTRVGCCLTGDHQTRLKRLASDKHSSLLRTFVNYGSTKFYNTEPRCLADAAQSELASLSVKRIVWKVHVTSKADQGFYIPPKVKTLDIKSTYLWERLNTVDLVFLRLTCVAKVKLKVGLFFNTVLKSS